MDVLVGAVHHVGSVDELVPRALHAHLHLRVTQDHLTPAEETERTHLTHSVHLLRTRHVYVQVGKQTAINDLRYGVYWMYEADEMYKVNVNGTIYLPIFWSTSTS